MLDLSDTRDLGAVLDQKSHFLTRETKTRNTKHPQEVNLLTDAVYRTKAGLTRTESSAMVDLVLKEITDTIAQGEAVKLSSFGTFLVRKKGQRTGRNPKTGVEVPIVPRRVVLFKASALMKQKIQRKPKPALPDEITASNFRALSAEPVS